VNKDYEKSKLLPYSVAARGRLVKVKVKVNVDLYSASS